MKGSESTKLLQASRREFVLPMKGPAWDINMHAPLLKPDAGRRIWIVFRIVSQHDTTRKQRATHDVAYSPPQESVPTSNPEVKASMCPFLFVYRFTRRRIRWKCGLQSSRFALGCRTFFARSTEPEVLMNRSCPTFLWTSAEARNPSSTQTSSEHKPYVPGKGQRYSGQLLRQDITRCGYMPTGTD